ncbi:metal-sensitive transcriptional regulator [uncultured Bdellovibrio sp.]|uniref:metal-sensitive transcriptional regulator n=1 Tax=Bdellovibrio sp. HCB-162 TaxID=3394234 RepID=UPI0025FB1650|nr:metal-sensitive transcriptional regulator [uncultured Bdellovibrio sp.]
MKKETVPHPDHSAHIKRLNRVRGQLDGIEKMITERRYCPDIIFQIRAAEKALKAVESEIMKTHIHGCVKTAVKSKDSKEISTKIDEIMYLVNK